MRRGIAVPVLGAIAFFAAFAASGTAAATTTDAAKRGNGITVRVLKREFRNCRRAASWLSAAAEAGRAKAFFSTKAGSPAIVRSPGGDFTVSHTVTWRYDTRRSRTRITVPTWPDMSRAEEAGVQRYIDAIKAHEDGHHRLARTFLSARRKTITGEGRTPAKAQTQLNSKIAEYARTVRSELQAASDLYDERTSHGTRQSLVGGQDVKLACP